MGRLLSVTAPSCSDAGQLCFGATQQQLHPLGPCTGKYDGDRSQQVRGGTDVASIFLLSWHQQLPLELHSSECDVSKNGLCFYS